MENEKELLKRYKEGNCTPEEKKKLEAWYDRLSENEEWNWTENEKADIKFELKERIDHQIGLQKTRRFKYRMLAAASVLLIFVTSIALYQNSNSPAIDHLIERFTYREEHMPAGERGKIVLADGSTVFMNGATTLRFPNHFAGNIRKVILVEGEAFFDIKHDVNKPFIVETNGINVRVLGTAFNIRSYKTFNDIKVTVTRGKVAVKAIDPAKSEKQAVLVANEQVSVNKQSFNIQKSLVDSKSITDWREGKFAFDNESLGDITATLQYARDIKVHFAKDDLKSIRCSAHFESSDSLEDIIFALSRANGLSFTIKNGEVFLRRN
jgi:transmembrane sensor